MSEKTNNSGLKSNYLSFTQVLGQSIANIGPSVGPALGIPVVVAAAGNGTWLTYVIATVTMILVGYNINQFTKRSATPGSLYTYIADGMGSTAGFIGGWGLVFAYLMLGCACLAGFASYGSTILGYIGIKAPLILVAVVGALLAWYIAYKDVKLSAKLMLSFEVVSLLILSVFMFIILANRGFSIDFDQVGLKGVSFDGLRIGLVLAFFSFTGFESAAALGGEAKNPLKSIPRVLISCIIIVGIIFLFFSYTEIAGFQGSGQDLATAQAPLVFLADRNGVGFLGVLMSIGALISFWSCVVAVITASARIVYYMSHHKILPKTFSSTHEKHNTPHVAVTVFSIVLLIIPVVLMALGCGAFDIFGWVGTIATFGFLLCYTLNVIAVPMYLAKNKMLKPINLILSAVTVGVLMIPIIGSIYPVPAYPFNLFPFIFLGWIAVGLCWFIIKTKMDPSVISFMRYDIKAVKEKVS